MEKRIKTLSVVTILAILAFIAMQVYWVHSRYEYSLSRYEDNLSEKILDAVADYKEVREHSYNKNDTSALTQKEFSLEQTYGDSVETKRTARVITYHLKAQEILGLPADYPLTYEQKVKAADMVAAKELVKHVDAVRTFDASGARSEDEAWAAARNVQLQMSSPFTVEGMDSTLRNAGIRGEVSLVVTDSMVWQHEMIRSTSSLSPEITMRVPYSELECLSVEIKSPIRIYDVIPGMIDSLVIALALSALLILCLVWQFSTIVKLNRLDKMRNDFVHTMIHELKRPISTLKMCVSSIENERIMADSDSRREVMGDCREALNNLSAYFSRLRDITFNEAGEIPLNFSSFNMRDMVSEVIGKTVIPSDKKVVLKDISPADMDVVCDRLHLSQILSNLIENAVKYSGDEVCITVDYGISKDGKAYLSVADTGNGIAESERRHLFDKFYRGKEAMTGGQPGMGLGLAYVKLLAEAHGGTVEVESKEGAGSCFTVKIPQS